MFLKNVATYRLSLKCSNKYTYRFGHLEKAIHVDMQDISNSEVISAN